jgi:hypothetical protein
LPSNARSPEEARAQVNRQHRQHADFIKIILLPRAAFFAVIDDAKRLGLPTAGHLPPDISPSEAPTAGFGSIEHFGTGSPFWFDCSVDFPIAAKVLEYREVTKLKNTYIDVAADAR